MAENSKIEWTDATWNALRGCTRVSAGCTNCYAEAMAGRFSDPGKWGHGIATREPESRERYVLRGRWTGHVVLDENALFKPLRWRRPRRIFVTSIGDPFHSAVTDDMLDRMFAVMVLAPQHTFQLLTKRPERMARYLDVAFRREHIWIEAERISGLDRYQDDLSPTWPEWPLPNIWLGTSVEDQAAADARIPHLLATPAAKRFISAEPLLGPVDVNRWLDMTMGGRYHAEPILDWVIVGGESGPHARTCRVEWIDDIRRQCSGVVPLFVKQLGSRFVDEENGIGGRSVKVSPDVGRDLTYRLKHPKGGDMAEWPERLRVREMP